MLREPFEEYKFDNWHMCLYMTTGAKIYDKFQNLILIS